MKLSSLSVVPYDPQWPQLFEAQATSIKATLMSLCLAIHHVGSTAIPGLAAKPKIDILLVIQDPVAVRERLEGIGFQYRGEYNIPFHYGYSKRGDADVNLHAYEEGHPEIELNLTFRNYLRTHDHVRDAYAALKYELLRDASSHEKKDSPFSNYTLRKGDFIRQVLKAAGFNQLRMLKCNDATEWSAAKHFRQTYFFDKVPMEDPYTWTFHHPDHVHFVLYQGVEVIGYAHIQLWPDQRSALRIIVVEPVHRKNGLGGQFLTMLEKWLRQQGRKSLHTESSPTAYPFYTKYGYTEMPFEDPDNHPTDPQDIPMGKRL
jgi:GrpB-like predicted nucleotidyltransferase (UPF0157 family)/GNAT superfamily N-acetyltransferase